MIGNGENFRLVDGATASAALATFLLFAPDMRPAIGSPPPRSRRRNGALTPEHVKAKMSRAQYRHHAARLGISLAELSAYRRLRESKRLTQAEALHVIKQERVARRRSAQS